MTELEAAFLGLLQGLTEFLPVSSSGHLVLAKHLAGIDSPGAAFEIYAHAGTLLAILLHYRREVGAMGASVLAFRWNVHSRLFLLLLLGTIPAALAGGLFANRIEATFDRPLLVSGLLAVTGLVLLSTARLRPGGARIGAGVVLAVGVAQALAVLPGISRSGATISAGLHLGLSRERAGDLSFLLAVPALLGALAWQVARAAGEPEAGGAAPRLIGAGVAFVTGYAALRLLLGLLARGRLFWFGFYCLGAALLGAVLAS